jgi:hypothetical protein
VARHDRSYGVWHSSRAKGGNGRRKAQDRVPKANRRAGVSRYKAKKGRQSAT